MHDAFLKSVFKSSPVASLPMISIMLSWKRRKLLAALDEFLDDMQ